MQKNANCRFSLAVMADDYAAMILKALSAVDTVGIQASTDLLSTTYIGTVADVFAKLQEIFAVVNDGETHITLEATLSPTTISQEMTNSNEFVTTKSFVVHGKIACYSLQNVNHHEQVAQIVELAKLVDIFDRNALHGCEFHGDINDLFKFFTASYHYVDEYSSDFVIQISLSVNSPILKNKKQGVVNYV